MVVCAALGIVTPAAAQSLVVSQSTLTFTGVADSTTPPAAQTIQITSTGANLQFTLSGGQALYEAVSPVTATTPATITIAPTPNLLGTYKETLYFVPIPYLPPYPPVTTVQVDLTYTLPPPPVITSVVNAASFQPGPLAPGEIVSIFGQNLAWLYNNIQPVPLFYFPQYKYFPTSSNRTSVSINGTLAPLLFANSTQVNAVVPLEIAGQSSVSVVLTHYGVSTTPLTISASPTAPAIFTASGQGTGPGAILNTNSSLNTTQNPAPKGSIIQIFAEGSGVWNQSSITISDGFIDNIGPGWAQPIAAVALTIGGQPAQILFAGQAPDQLLGVLQVNAIIPTNIASGPQPVVLTVGNASNAGQQITVAVQ